MYEIYNVYNIINSHIFIRNSWFYSHSEASVLGHEIFKIKSRELQAHQPVRCDYQLLKIILLLSSYSLLILYLGFLSSEI